MGSSSVTRSLARDIVFGLENARAVVRQVRRVCVVIFYNPYG